MTGKKEGDLGQVGIECGVGGRGGHFLRRNRARACKASWDMKCLWACLLFEYFREIKEKRRPDEKLRGCTIVIITAYPPKYV